MIIKGIKSWKGYNQKDIDKYLRIYSEEKDIDIKDVICHKCGNDSFNLIIDQDEGVIQVKCTKCETEKILLDCEEYWEDAEPELQVCPVCNKGESFNVKVGFVRRENGSVKWVYIGNRCTKCKSLGSYLDWKISYEPTTKMEQNI